MKTPRTILPTVMGLGLSTGQGTCPLLRLEVGGGRMYRGSGRGGEGEEEVEIWISNFFK